ncbi:enoyl-ACP reductase [Motilibacter sp. E257]|uniref:Enoyl-ACP reductase n=1 Tax=Motilibacter deserti TaxID=2714956 RepID=A0ABX0GVQ1_9ACTN|nr:enoyl-ACP reductase [Motilibacter deserti]
MLDVVLLGATGLVGRATAAYLAGAAPPGTRVGLAGRSRDRLHAVRDGLPDAAASWPLLVVDVGDDEALSRLVARTRVVATTVGPYARHGLPLVVACARSRTDYVDLTGETLFVRRSIDAAHGAAVRSGARIVHAAGFDSVPSDLAVLLLAERARADGAGTLTRTVLVAGPMRGGIGGGTYESLREQLDAARRDPRARAVLRDPYALSPDRRSEPPDPRGRPVVDRLGGAWTAPFPMAPFNSRVVRRSNALLGFAYGRGLDYSEALRVAEGPAGPPLAAATALGLGALGLLLAAPATRRVVDRALPAPGEGPSLHDGRPGHFRTTTRTVTTEGARYAAVVGGPYDPGYAATARMLAQSALCLALDRDELPDRAGVLTPATALGGRLADRLRAAGLTLSVAPA